MKTILFLTSAILLNLSALSQGVKIVSVDDLNTDISGTTIEVVGSPSDNVIYSDLKVVNLSGGSIDMAFKRIRRLDSDWLDQICDNSLCYNADDALSYTTPSPVTIDDQDTSVFKPQVVPNGLESCGIHDYYVVNSSGVVYDSIRIKFKTQGQNCSLSLTEEVVELNDFSFYPNPAQKNLIIESPSVGNLIFIDALGKQILKTEISKATNTVDVSSLKNGVYFIQTINNKGVLSETKKLIVQK